MLAMPFNHWHPLPDNGRAEPSRKDLPTSGMVVDIGFSKGRRILGCPIKGRVLAKTRMPFIDLPIQDRVVEMNMLRPVADHRT